MPISARPPGLHTLRILQKSCGIVDAPDPAHAIAQYDIHQPLLDARILDRPTVTIIAKTEIVAISQDQKPSRPIKRLHHIVRLEDILGAGLVEIESSQI